jgi:hypothetical protein
LGQKIHVQKAVGSNPAVYWIDVSDASYYIYIERKKNKGSQMGHTKKNKVRENKRESKKENKGTKAGIKEKDSIRVRVCVLDR